VQQQVRMKTLKGRFSSAGNLHLTLCFLGETKPELTLGLRPFLQEAAALGQSFPLRFARELHYFGTEKPARVVWLGLRGELMPLRLLQNLVAQAVEKAGLPQEERPYIPHVTLARNCVFSDDVPLAQGEIQFSTSRLPEFEVTGFSLMISEQVDGKRIYRALERFVFPEECQ
jgi:2'-5' RNA ligase